MRTNKRRICGHGRLPRGFGQAAESSKYQQIRERDPMPNDPEAPIDWGKRNIQDEPVDEFERRRHARRQKSGITYFRNIVIFLP